MKTNKEILKKDDVRKERNRSSYSELPEDDEHSPAKSNKKEHSKSTKENKDWGLRKIRLNKAVSEKNDPERFSGEGVNFKGKIIGIENVFDARGNRMCQDALQKLKAAVKLSGEHKQRIILNISLCGIRIKDEKTGEIMHEHPVHKISFISQDVSDSRAFGYVYGCPKTGHQFFGIKTEKTAAQIVCTLRDLFHTALEIKRKEMEQAMELQGDEQENEETPQQNGQKESNCLSNGSVEVKMPREENASNKSTEPIYSDITPNGIHDTVHDSPVAETETASAVDTLLDLRFEMDNLQQGISQMDHSIASATSFGFSVSEDDTSVCSSSSSVITPRKLNRLSSIQHETMSMSSRSSSTSDYTVYNQDCKAEESELPFRNDVCSIASTSTNVVENNVVHEKIETPPPKEPVEDKYAVFYDIDSLPSVFDNPILLNSAEPQDSTNDNASKDSEESVNSQNYNSSDDLKPTQEVFAELDPLGVHPYVDKKNFFHEIKNPPKKVLKELAGDSMDGNSSAAEDDTSAGQLLNGSSEFTDKHNNLFANLPATPPKLPPKRSYSVTSPSPYISKNESRIVEDPVTHLKNPFNPFSTINEDFPDVPPPNSPPPPPPRIPFKDLDVAYNMSPPPRPPSKDTDQVYNMSPPPRPPSRTSCAPMPPRPHRKTLTSTSGTWFSFDQEALSAFSTTHSVYSDNLPPYSPPIPAPSRKLPVTNKCDSSTYSCSASNSPAASRKHLNHSPSLNYSVNDLSENQNAISNNSRKPILTKHSSVIHEPWLDKARTDIPQSVIKNPFVEPSAQITAIKNQKEELQSLNCSPPVPPKSNSISRPRPSPSKKMLSVSNSISRSSSNSSSSDRSSNSVHYSSLDESGNCSGSEITQLKSTSSPSDMSSSGYNGELSGEITSSESVVQEKRSPVSPDSIFRRKSDPFADDFFLSLPKKSNCASVQEDNTEENANVFEANFDNAEIPIYAEIIKSTNDVS